MSPAHPPVVSTVRTARIPTRQTHSRKERPMRAIFISYRREDSEGQAGRLFNDLARHFGEDSVFMDVAGIEAGRDFRQVIDENVATCGVLLAMIGKSWIDAKDEFGRSRLEDPTDFVRLETSSALKRDIPVVPVLVQGARMPRAEQLPEDLSALAYRNGVELTHARWDSDVQVLVKALGRYVESQHEDADHAKTSSSARVPSKAERARNVRPSGVSGRVDAAPVVTAQPPKRSLGRIIAGSVVAIVVAVGGYAWYQKSSQNAEMIRQAALFEAAKKQAVAAQIEAQRQAEAKAAAELEAKRLAQEKVDAEKLEAERQAKLDADRKAKLDADRKAKLDADRKAKLDADRQAKVDADRKAKLDADRQAKVDADRKAKLDADSQPNVDADRQAKLDARFRGKGELIIPEGRMVDLDDGRLADPGEADIGFPGGRGYIEPLNGALMAIMRTLVRRDGKSCVAARLSALKLSLSDLPQNARVCVRTNQGHYAFFRVVEAVGPRPRTLKIFYYTWN
jgi:TIR domain